MVLRGDDPLALRDGLRLAELSDRRWFQFPQGTDPAWQSYWNGGAPREGAVVRGVQECLQAVLWNGTVGLAPLGHDLPAALAVVPLTDMPPSRVVAVWNEGDTNPLTRSFDALTSALPRALSSRARGREQREDGSAEGVESGQKVGHLQPGGEVLLEGLVVQGSRRPFLPDEADGCVRCVAQLDEGLCDDQS